MLRIGDGGGAKYYHRPTGYTNHQNRVDSCNYPEGDSVGEVVGLNGWY